MLEQKNLVREMFREEKTIEVNVITLFISAWFWFILSFIFLLFGILFYYSVEQWLGYVMIIFFAVTFLMSLIRKWDIKRELEL